MENNLLEKAKQMITNLANMGQNATENDKQAAKKALDAAYSQASLEERQHLEELEQQLKQEDQIH